MSWFEDLSHLTGKSLMGHDHCVLQVIPRLDVVVEVCVSVKIGGSSLDAKCRNAQRTSWKSGIVRLNSTNSNIGSKSQCHTVQIGSLDRRADTCKEGACVQCMNV